MTGGRNQRLFERLRDGCSDEWRAYVEHRFVREMAAGTLPEAAFRAYLVQDYLFLIQFARAYALAAFKSDRVADMKSAATGLDAILNTEMALHVGFCADWGLSEADMAAAPEHSHNIAYTRYVLDCGMAGDLLDMHVALAPCMVGYAEIGARLVADPATVRDGNPYWRWIETYAADDFQAVAAEERAMLDRLAARTGVEARFERLQDIFRTATRLEAGFWQMGLDLQDAPLAS